MDESPVFFRRQRAGHRAPRSVGLRASFSLLSLLVFLPGLVEAVRAGRAARHRAEPGNRASLPAELTTLALAGALACGLFHWLSGRLVVAPVQAVVATTRRLTDGDLAARTPAQRRPRELEQLANGIDELASSLQVLAQGYAAAPVRDHGEPSWLILLDDEGRITGVDPACARAFGYEPGELMGKKIWVLVPDDLRPRAREHVEAFKASDRRMFAPRHEEHTWGRRKDGSLIRCSSTAFDLRATGREGYAIFVRLLDDDARAAA